jgi:hypothetical protein
MASRRGINRRGIDDVGQRKQQKEAQKTEQELELH